MKNPFADEAPAHVVMIALAAAGIALGTMVGGLIVIAVHKPGLFFAILMGALALSCVYLFKYMFGKK